VSKLNQLDQIRLEAVLRRSLRQEVLHWPGTDGQLWAIEVPKPTFALYGIMAPIDALYGIGLAGLASPVVSPRNHAGGADA
jgi:hypothetical protein